MAIKRLLTSDEISKLEERSDYLMIYPDDEGEDYRGPDENKRFEVELSSRIQIDRDG